MLPSTWPSRLLYRRGRKSRRDLRITLYAHIYTYTHTRPRSWTLVLLLFQVILQPCELRTSLKLFTSDRFVVNPVLQCMWRSRKFPQFQYFPQLSEKESVLRRDRSLVGVTNTEAFSACIFARQILSNYRGVLTRYCTVMNTAEPAS